MKKILLTILTAALLISCVANKKQPEHHTQAMNILGAATNYLLSGKYDAAMNGYIRAEEKFVSAGDFCNAARAGILLFTSDPSVANINFLNDAKRNADSGSCDIENEMVNLGYAMLHSQGDSYNIPIKEFDYSKLEEPYKTIAKYEETRDINIIKKLAKSSDISDRMRSVLYRIVAKEEIKLNPQIAEQYILLAKILDSMHSWTLNLLYDNQILKDIYIATGDNHATIDEQINQLKITLEK